ncbi:alpha-L-arabinofuranosidase [Salipaludibacillus neizhouensis]|uniref:non-reducing end alpha-L-arabinofuranosidase n=1 Tax=Salipaludibacillus neizhouensis TaxID=885475 RepID=A0A3A9K3V8_9BACI|nr:alpha-L-arabinofuranosidase C-terminal domain-containing protein [Salipaludibacillus neizhouensis]RKL65172.1 alpha-L-arabinofuranosidase [Salipaludibacillus neizhouensis]
MSEQKKLIIHTKQKQSDLGDLFGIFFEDLNHAADGGLYAELVQNRSFEFDPIDNKEYHALTAWEKVEHGDSKVNMTVEKEDPLHSNNVHYLSLNVIGTCGRAGVKNLGFNSGIPVKQGNNYLFSFYARTDSDQSKVMTVALESADEKDVHAVQKIEITASKWKRYEVTLTSSETDNSSRLVLTTEQQGNVYIDMVSLFPEKTYKDRHNGLRKDIAEKLEALTPKFMRFPGGCLVHDGSLKEDDRNSMYRWKNTIGNVETRAPRRNNWHYHQTLGLGYYEYFQFCEDIGAKPIPILPAGYDPHHQRIVPIEELKPWIDDALDLIEFATGGSTTEWGAKRMELGHPEPFELEYIGIGNEEVGEPFYERYAYFHKAIKERYPDIKIINSSGPFAAGSEYERGWKSAKENNSDFVDEHYYQSAEWFLANYHRYDDFREGDPKVFLGEYATGGNTYYNALAEAAFMTGLEKNAHAVGLACYAPMLCNVDYVKWDPNLIWFNNHEVYGTPNYYVQKLFMNHQGDYGLNVELKGFKKQKEPKDKPIVGNIKLGSIRNTSHFHDIVVTNKDTGEKKDYKAMTCEGMDHLTLDNIKWGNYELSLKAKKSDGPLGFKIYFGHEDDKNHFIWEIGGWENQDSLIATRAKSWNSCLTQSRFSVENDKEYHLKLAVMGREIRTFIDGTLINETKDKLPVIEPLYYSASIDETTRYVILKVVNVQSIPMSTQLIVNGLDEERYHLKIHELSGYELEAKNSFEFPEHIIPKETEIVMRGNTIDYEFQKHSVTIIRMRPMDINM